MGQLSDLGSWCAEELLAGFLSLELLAGMVYVPCIYDSNICYIAVKHSPCAKLEISWYKAGG